MASARGQIPEGKYTATVYNWITEGRYQDAIDVLTVQLQYTPDSRAALSLLGYTHFQVRHGITGIQISQRRNIHKSEFLTLRIPPPLFPSSNRRETSTRLPQCTADWPTCTLRMRSTRFITRNRCKSKEKVLPLPPLFLFPPLNS